MDKQKRREDKKRKRALEKQAHKRKMDQRYGAEEIHRVKGFRPGKGPVSKPLASDEYDDLPPENPSFRTGL